MKKIIFLFLILFVSILTANAQSNFILGDQISNMYIVVEKGGYKFNFVPTLLYNGDNVIYSLSLNENLNLEGSYNSFTYNDSIFNLTDEILDKINAISYYGYGYNNHTDIKWYGITQFLIFKNLGVDDIYFSDKDGNKLSEYEKELKELDTLVEKHYLLPKFTNKNDSYGPYWLYSLSDKNKVIDLFEIEENDFNMSVENNNLKFKTKEEGTYNVTFLKQSSIKQDYVLYSNENNNLFISPGKLNDITFTLTLRVIGGSITIKRYELTPGERLETTLVGSEIGIYKDNGLIATLFVDENGEARIDNLPLGMYTVKERTFPKGYVGNIYTHTVYLEEGDEDKVLSWGSSVIEGNLIINKYYGEEGNYKLDDEATFEVYHNNNLIKTLKPINGIIKEKLEYGTYTIKQVSGIKYYDLCEEFTVKIDKVTDYKYDLYTELDKGLNDFLDEKKEELNAKDEVLSEKEKELEKEESNLLNLKNELLKKEEELEEERNLVNIEKEMLINLKTELNDKQNELEDKTSEFLKKEQELNKLKSVLELKENKLILKEENINKLELNIKIKEDELNKMKEELEMLKCVLLKKEKDLINKETNIKEKEKLLKKQEDSIIKLQSKYEKENVLVVEVPNTYKRNYNKVIFIALVLIGSIIIIFKKRKVTNR